MFESPARTKPLLTLEPWAASYGFAFELEEEDEPNETPAYEVNPVFESEDWSRPIIPRQIAFPSSVAFVDGVQRIESWAHVDDGATVADAALASVVAGATVLEDGHSHIEHGRTSRVLAVAGGLDTPPLVVSRYNLVFEVQRSKEQGKRAAHQAVAVKRRDLEGWWVHRQLKERQLVVADGRLDQHITDEKLVGVAKTLNQLYLAGERALIPHLQAGTRTPIFMIGDSWGTRLSWFLRLPYTRVIHHSYAGIVRLEIPETNRSTAREIADMVSSNLPRFASRPEHDPRAPQNLLPVGALEKRLRHEMGDTTFIRRAIEDHLMEEFRA